MSAEDGNTRPRRVPTGVSVACILAALYVPQSWIFFTDYSMSDPYWLGFLRFLPGLPVFNPVVALTHPNDTLGMVSSWAGAALLAIGLFVVNRKRPVLFWLGLAVAFLLSIFSALGAHRAFVS